ncbi:MAG TPA: hypothetical protein VKZ84_04265 [Bacteriovoracaceae bacterium]|nr:hypothetical protein [Bacteriovoracaceae bacterium]
MKSVNGIIKNIIDPKLKSINARLFVTRNDGITIYDSTEDETTSSVSALVSGVWQASEALMGLVGKNNNLFDYRLGFDTSSEGIYLFSFEFDGKSYCCGAIYKDCLNPGLLKRQVMMLKSDLETIDVPFKKNKDTSKRDGFLFTDITDEEMDNLFTLGGK